MKIVTKTKKEGITKRQIWAALDKYQWDFSKEIPIKELSEEFNMMPMDILFLMEYLLNLRLFKKDMRPVTVEVVRKRYAKRKMNFGIYWRIRNNRVEHFPGQNYSPTGGNLHKSTHH